MERAYGSREPDVDVRKSYSRLTVTTVATPTRRRLGVDAERPHYKWWALSCRNPWMLLSDVTLAPFVSIMHTALWVLPATSVFGAAVSLLRRGHSSPA
jgi:hypothetical protein